MKQIKLNRATVRAIALQKDHINAEVLVPIMCIGAGLMIPFITLANLLMNRYH
jgi:hypothetical protein